MDSRIITAENISVSSAELQELMDMLGDTSIATELEEVDLRQRPQEPESQEQTIEPLVQEAPVNDGSMIPEKAVTHLLDESVSRFSSADWFQEVQSRTVTLAGLGGIGSWTALLLARLKPNSLTLYDFDRVDVVNMAGQLFCTEDVNISKVSAVNRLINRYGSYYHVVGMEEAVTQDSDIDKVTICGFDNMAARKALFTRWKSLYKGDHDALFIDGRLSAEEFQVFCITGKDLFLMKKYEENWLFEDKEAEATLCSYKQTSFCANMIASVMVNLFVNFITNLCDPVIPRALPFMTSYDASTMMFRTIMQ